VSPTFRALSVYNYRLYFAGSLVTNTGTWMQRVAQDWLVVEELEAGAVALGITTGLQFLPFLLVTPFAGVLADRYSKRLVLAITQSVMAVSALLLGILVVTGAVQLWHVYALALLMGIGAAVDSPARQSFVLEMVGRDNLTNAVGLNSSTFHGARVLGPALAGFIIAVSATGPVFFINFVSYGAVLLSLYLMRTAELEPAPRAERGPGLMREGLRYVRGRPDLQAVLLSVFAVGTFGMNFQMTSILMATDVFEKGPTEYGILGSIMAVGSLAGALVAARRTRVRVRLVIGGGVVFSLLEIVVGLMPTYLTFAIMLVPLGLASLTFMTAANALVQLTVAPHLRGRVMALYMTIFMGGTPIGAPLIGWVGEEYGARWTLIGGGALSLLGIGIAALMLLRRSGMTVRTTFRPWPRFQIAAAQLSDRAQQA
jgi:MFS family permease